MDNLGQNLVVPDPVFGVIKIKEVPLYESLEEVPYDPRTQFSQTIKAQCPNVPFLLVSLPQRALRAKRVTKIGFLKLLIIMSLRP